MSWWDSTLLLAIVLLLVAIYRKMGGQLDGNAETVDVQNAYLVERLILFDAGERYLEVRGRGEKNWASIEGLDIHSDPKKHEWIGAELYLNEKGVEAAIAQKTFELYRDYPVARARYEERKMFGDDFGATEGLAEQCWLKAIHVPAKSIVPKEMIGVAGRGKLLAGTPVYVDRKAQKSGLTPES